ncbi:hypothetical protein CONPUDRAFT_75699 [Coniophora puteana RWD-64-598 SS2]|uniref:Uncharacterized protein n=1 Tax=Coniophora puteana (strain RWD-64-598) TaxID=741705 RepID=A0A5M3MH42_CONPW|nr:uncharacterized protein CONPUDRAFT_75699 [Coniophora puteana RWD-64-598 SS2]EIW77945.1 hypothetical protein CONPUDRAFT_75699 [Coniophora puteana RWD-64-598 SS2]
MDPSSPDNSAAHALFALNSSELDMTVFDPHEFDFLPNIGLETGPGGHSFSSPGPMPAERATPAPAHRGPSGSAILARVTMLESQFNGLARRVTTCEEADAVRALRVKCSSAFEAIRKEADERLQKAVASLEKKIEEVGRVRTLAVEGAEEGAMEGSGDEGEDDDETGDRAVADAQAYHSTEIKSITRIAFARLMDVPKLTVDCLPEWPENEDDWPLGDTDDEGAEDEEGGGKGKGKANPKRCLLRFRWDEPWQHRDNWQGIRNIQKWIKASGPEVMTEATASINTISHKSLELRITEKYQALAKTWRLGKKSTPSTNTIVLPSDAPAGADGADEATSATDATAVLPPSTARPVLSKSSRQSRAGGVRGAVA